MERDWDRATQSSVEAPRTGKGFAGEFAALTKSGLEIPIEVTMAIIRDELGKDIGFIDIMRDVPERKKAEAALKESEQKYRLLFANMMDGFVHCRAILDEAGKPKDFVFLEVALN